VVLPMLARVSELPHVTGVVSPYAAGAHAVSRDGTIGFATHLGQAGKPAAESGGRPRDRDRRDRQLLDAAGRARRATGTPAYVGGATATAIDFARVISGKLPLFIGIVVLLSALLLLVVFRSLLIPLQAALMNLLSIAAVLDVV
jgi:putative drug exporter of the RND superfamily